MIKISVMVPVYNTSKYLVQCLESILKQSLKEIEIICVNDGSTDNSLEILEKYAEKDKRIIIVNKLNGGLTSARNAALEKAKGEYCINIDSDDWIEQDYLKTLYEKAKKDKLDIVISDIIVDSSKEKKIRKDLEIESSEFLNGAKYLEKVYTINFLGYTWNKLIKRNLYIENNIWYNEEIFLLEDIEALGRVAYYAKKIGKINKAFYHYRISENNGSKNIIFKHLPDTLKCFKSLEEFYRKHKEEKLRNLIIRRKNLRLIGMILGSNFDKFNEYDEFLNKYLLDIRKEGFILNKYKGNIVDESINKILLFNLLKIFPKKNVVFILKKIEKIIRSK